MDYFTDVEERDESEMNVDEDVDLWELFQCWLWGDKPVSGKRAGDAKHNPGNSHKAHKRKDGDDDGGDDGADEGDDDDDDDDVGFIGNIMNKLSDILSDDGKMPKRGSRGRWRV